MVQQSWEGIGYRILLTTLNSDDGERIAYEVQRTYDRQMEATLTVNNLWSMEMTSPLEYLWL